MASTNVPKNDDDNDNNNTKRKCSNASSLESEPLLNSLGSIGSSGLADIGTGLSLGGSASAEAATTNANADTLTTTEHHETQFPVPASLPQHQKLNLSSPEETNVHSSLPRLSTESSENDGSSKGSSRNTHNHQHQLHNLPERRLPSKKRKMSYESFDSTAMMLLGGGSLSASTAAADRKRKMSYDSAMGDSCFGLSLDSGMYHAILPKLPNDVASITTKGSASDGHHSGNHNFHHNLPGVSALDHLDALGENDDGHVSHTEDSHAPILKKPPPVVNATQQHPPHQQNQNNSNNNSAAGGAAAHSGGAEKDDHSDGDATFTSSGHRILMEAIMMTSGGGGGSGGLDGMLGGGGGGRKRFESWGGMSDLSVRMDGSDQNTAAAIAASALHHTGIIDDVTAAANFGGGSVDSSVTDQDNPNDHHQHHHQHHSHHPGAPAAASANAKHAHFDHNLDDSEAHYHQHRHHGRDRTASLSDSTFPVPGSLDGMEISSDLQKFVAAAVASVGDQLAELAGNIESAAAAVDLDSTTHKDMDDDTRQEGSEVSSIATPMALGVSLDDLTRMAMGDHHVAHSGSNANQQDAGLSVDYDAVAAAVDAAHAATGDLDLSAIVDEGGFSAEALGDHQGPISSTASSLSSGGTKRKRKLPLHGSTAGISISHKQLLKDVPKSSLSEQEQEEIRERARRAAGYVPPTETTSDSTKTPNKRTLPPLKKRSKRMTPEPLQAKSQSHVTPKVSNTSSSRGTDKMPSIVVSSSAGLDCTPRTSNSKAGNKEKSTQKWDGMFDCLLQFIQDRKDEETAGMSEEAIADWVWDGNVPTTYKTEDGKALGRWINNQRSAKSKGTLKDEREKRLVDAGLKWSVLASNSWNEMLDELRIYIKEYTKDGKKWDGNGCIIVPTNYRIKARANGKKMTEEDKNLGRWVNRQRSLYQSGKLRKDRQLALEKVGLKWSMLATTSWDAMYDTLLEYVKEKEAKGGKWDGNVPANYKTEDHPPRALGRWINRQRSAHVKKKLKQEYVDKLSDLGLKWSVHERPMPGNDDERMGAPMPQLAASAPIKADAQPSSSPKASSQNTGGGTLGASIPSTIAVPAKQTTKPPQLELKTAANPDLAAPEKVTSTSVRFDGGNAPNKKSTDQSNSKALSGDTKESNVEKSCQASNTQGSDNGEKVEKSVPASVDLTRKTVQSNPQGSGNGEKVASGQKGTPARSDEKVPASVDLTTKIVQQNLEGSGNGKKIEDGHKAIQSDNKVPNSIASTTAQPNPQGSGNGEKVTGVPKDTAAQSDKKMLNNVDSTKKTDQPNPQGSGHGGKVEDGHKATQSDKKVSISVDSPRETVPSTSCNAKADQAVVAGH